MSKIDIASRFHFVSGLNFFYQALNGQQGKNNMLLDSMVESKNASNDYESIWGT